MEYRLSMSQALGLAVKLHRGIKRWKQSDLANAIEGGLTQAHISKVESGNTCVSNKVLVKIAKALEIKNRQLWDTAEHIISTHSHPSESEDYLSCLVETGVHPEEVNALKAQVDVQTLARYERLSDSLTSGSFTKQDFDEFAELVERSTEGQGPVVQIFCDLSKRVGAALCDRLAEDVGSDR